jgi:hypothetical protein
VLSAWALVAAVLLAAAYAAGGPLRRARAAFWNESWFSAAGGASVAYVFVDALPELGARHHAFLAAAGETVLFAEQRIYLAAFAGFVAFYGLQHMVLASRGSGRGAGEAGSDAVYRLELLGFAAYSWVIGYLLVDRAARGSIALLAYAAAMTLHFRLVDHSLREEHGPAYERRGSWILAASVLAGSAVSLFTRLSEPYVSQLFAFVVGGVVMTSVRAELPREGNGRFLPFCLGAGAYALLLLAT